MRGSNRRLRRGGATLALAAAAAGTVAGPLAGRAFATEVYPVPADGVFVMDGHGWGHGIGMSQWGAEGAAQQGLSAASILSFYYPNTTPATVGGTIKVHIDENATAPVTVAPAAGLAVRQGDTGATAALPTGSAYQRWRVTLDSAGEHLQHYTGTSWATQKVFDATAFSLPLEFQVPLSTPFITAYLANGTQRDFRGRLVAARSGSTLAEVNFLPLEQYLYGVVPSESPSSWAPAALQSQAVAARTYAVNDRNATAGQPWNICDTTWCQVYGGYDAEAATSTAAVNATAGEILTNGGAPIDAMFSASNGGWSVSGSTPYLTAHADPYDAVAPEHTWQGQVTAAQLQAAFPAVGRLLRLVVTSRDGNGDWGGRVLGVTLQGVDTSGNPTSVTTTGEGIYLANPWPGASNGMLSNWWTVDAVSRIPGPYPGSTPAAYVQPGGPAYAVYTDTASHVDYRTLGSTGWTLPTSLGGTAVGGPATAQSESGRPLVFVRGSDNQLYEKWPVSTGWSAWYPLGGLLTSRPAALRWATGAQAVFVRGSNGSLYVRQWTATGGWGPWGSLGGRLMSGTAPAAASDAPGHIAVFVQGTNGMLYVRRYASGAGWGSWVSTGASLAGDPAAASPTAGLLTVGLTGRDGAEWVATSVRGAALSSWQSLGGTPASSPGLAAGGGTMWLMALGSDGNVWARSTTSPAPPYTWAAWSAVT